VKNYGVLFLTGLLFLSGIFGGCKWRKSVDHTFLEFLIDGTKYYAVPEKKYYSSYWPRTIISLQTKKDSILSLNINARIIVSDQTQTIGTLEMVLHNINDKFELDKKYYIKTRDTIINGYEHKLDYLFIYFENNRNYFSVYNEGWIEFTEIINDGRFYYKGRFEAVLVDENNPTDTIYVRNGRFTAIRE
jgi:hypothetical protein